VKVVLTAVGSSGDVFPFIGLGVGLKERGHEVTLITHGHFVVPVLRAGIGFAPVGTEQDYLMALGENPMIWDPEHGYPEVVRCASALIPELYETILDNLEDGRTVLVAHYLDFAARLVQENTGVPTLTAVVSPAAFRFAATHLATAPLPLPLENLREDIGPGWNFSSLMTVGLFPSWFGSPEPEWPERVQLTGFPLFDRGAPLPPEVDRFLDDGPPPVVFTLGPNLQMSRFADSRGFLGAAIDSCRRLGERGLILGALREPPPELPTGMQHAPFAPLTEVLPRSAALVHHGGVGTSAAGLMCGAPQLIAPVCHDQPDNAERVKGLGVGDVLEPTQFQGPVIAERLRTLWGSSEVAGRCAATSDRTRRTNAIGAACALVEFVAPLGIEVAPSAHSLAVDPRMAQPVGSGCT